MLRAIHIFPQFHNIELIQELRKKYDPLYSLVLPHITLVFPFESNISSLTLEQHVKETLVGVCPFSIKLEGISGTLDNYLFLNVKNGNDHLIKIHDLLYSGILENFLNRRITFIPHLTVGKLENEAELKSALTETQAFKASFETLVTEVTSEIIGNKGESDIEFTVSLV